MYNIERNSSKKRRTSCGNPQKKPLSDNHRLGQKQTFTEINRKSEFQNDPYLNKTTNKRES